MKIKILLFLALLIIPLTGLSSTEEGSYSYIEDFDRLQNNEFFGKIAEFDLGILFRKDTACKYSSFERINSNRIRVNFSTSPFYLNDFIYIEFSLLDFSIFEYGKKSEKHKPKNIFSNQTIAWNYAFLFFNFLFPRYLTEDFSFEIKNQKKSWEIHGIRKDSADGGSPYILFSKQNGKLIELSYGQ